MSGSDELFYWRYLYFSDDQVPSSIGEPGNWRMMTWPGSRDVGTNLVTEFPDGSCSYDALGSSGEPPGEYFQVALLTQPGGNALDYGYYICRHDEKVRLTRVIVMNRDEPYVVRMRYRPARRRRRDRSWITSSCRV